MIFDSNAARGVIDVGAAFSRMLPEATIYDRLMLLLRRRQAFRVAGDSMLPTLKDGDVVIIRPKAFASEGSIVLAQHPYKRSVKILKRVAGVTDEGHFTLIGDNPAASTDSRTFGNISIKYILGKAECRLK